VVTFVVGTPFVEGGELAQVVQVVVVVVRMTVEILFVVVGIRLVAVESRSVVAVEVGN